MLNLSCNLLILYWKWETEWLSVYQLFTLTITWLTGNWGSLPLPSIRRENLTASRQPGKRSKFKVRFLLNAYCFCTVAKWKDRNLNHGKLGTICIRLYQDTTSRAQDTPTLDEGLLVYFRTPARVGRRVLRTRWGLGDELGRVGPTSVPYNQSESIENLVTRLCLTPRPHPWTLPAPPVPPGGGQPAETGVYHLTTEIIIVAPLPGLPLSLGVWNRARSAWGAFLGEYGQGWRCKT